jgi:O-antigen/teichoic acid export membrane protein
LALAITVASGLGAAVLSLGGLWVRREVSFFSPALTNIRASLADGWHVFVATAAISLYTNSNTVLLGILAGNRAVALFVAAEKVVKASFLILTPISQSLYPRLSYLMAHDRPQAFGLIRRSAWIVGSVAVALLLGIAGLAPWVVPLLFGPGFADAVPLLQLMSVLPLAIGLSNLLGVQTMLPLGMKREVSVVVIGCGAVNVALLILLVPHWGARGAAISVALTEILVAGAMGAALYWRCHAA